MLSTAACKKATYGFNPLSTRNPRAASCRAEALTMFKMRFQVAVMGHGSPARYSILTMFREVGLFGLLPGSRMRVS